MITEDYVSFETAKLLKERGFDAECDYLYVNGKLVKAQGFACNWNNGETLFADYKNECSAPTLQMAMKWLREKCIFITLNIISFNLNDSPVWSFDIWHNNNHEYRSSDYFDSYEKTCEAAIKYYLKNLI